MTVISSAGFMCFCLIFILTYVNELCANSRQYLLVNGADVSLEVSRGLEAVVADGANVIVVLVNAPDVVVQVRPSLELLATPKK